MKIFRFAIFALCIVSSMQLKAQSKRVQSHTSQKLSSTNNNVEKKVISESDFLKKYTSVKNISWEPGYVAILEKTDGSKELYHLDNRTDEKKFVAKYGQILRQSQTNKKSGE